MSDQYPQWEIPPTEGSLDGLAPPPAPPKSRRPVPKTLLTAIVGVLVVAAGGFAVVSLSAGDGSSSAEDAVEKLFDAVDDQDAIGVAESLEPSERRILVKALNDTANEARRVEVVDGGLDLNGVEGVELEVDGLQMHATELDDDTYAVDIDSGRISSRAQLSKMPIGPVVQELIDRDQDAGGDFEDTNEDTVELAGTRIVAVKRGGEWYVSALYSLAEQIRLDGDPVAAYPKPGTAIPAIGADSPEAAVREGSKPRSPPTSGASSS